MYGSNGRVIGRYGNDYLIGVGTEGVFIVDISNRTNPVVVGNVSLPEEPNVNILAGRPGAISGSVVYVGAGNHLYSVDISAPTNPVILDSVSATQPTAVVTYGTYAYAGARVSSWGLYAVNISDPSDMKVEDCIGIGMNDLDEENDLLYTSGGTIISPIGGGELPLQISLIKVSSITENSAIISWQTNKEADSLVKYGTSQGSYPEQKYDPNPTKYHSIKLDNLSPNTTYYFVLESKTANETATSTEGTFKTKAPLGRRLQASITIKNMGENISGLFRAVVFYARNLTNSSNLPEEDYRVWQQEADIEDVADFGYISLQREETAEAETDGVPVNIWQIGDKIDVGVVVAVEINNNTFYADSMLFKSAVTITPSLNVKIHEANFTIVE